MGKRLTDIRPEKILVFEDGIDMLHEIYDNDLYNIVTGEYVFQYNEKGAIAVYQLSEEEAVRLDELSSSNGEYWGAMLGPGGNIYDDPLTCFEDMGSSGYNNLDWCKDHCLNSSWVRVSDIHKHLSQSQISSISL